MLFYKNVHKGTTKEWKMKTDGGKINKPPENTSVSRGLHVRAKPAAVLLDFNHSV